MVVKFLNLKAIKNRIAETTAHTIIERPVKTSYYIRFNGWYADYTFWTTTVGTYDTGYVLSNFEANLYQQGNKAMVWSTFVEVNARDDDTKGVNDLADALVMRMKKDVLI